MNSGLTSYNHGLTETGPPFKVSSEKQRRGALNVRPWIDVTLLTTAAPVEPVDVYIVSSGLFCYHLGKRSKLRLLILKLCLSLPLLLKSN